MDKAQIEMEIRRYKRYISCSEQKIDNYNAKIRTLEKNYDKATSAANRMQDYIDSYRRSVLSALNRLDGESTFKEYYNEKLLKIINGREREEIFDDFRKGKQQIVREIDECENQIARERRKINDYNIKISRLKEQRNML